MATFSFERKSTFPVDKIWSVLGDFSASPGPDIEVKILEQGDPAANGVGAVRTIQIGKSVVKEVLEASAPPHSFTYRILGGVPMKEYLATASFKESDGGTTIRWQGELKPSIPFTGGICCNAVKKNVNLVIDAVEKTLA